MKCLGTIFYLNLTEKKKLPGPKAGSLFCDMGNQI